MGKESSSQAQEPAVVVDVPASPSADASASSDSDGEVAKVHQFNEQTNYVPKRTIITVIRTHFSDNNSHCRLHTDSHRSFSPVPALTC